MQGQQELVARRPRQVHRNAAPPVTGSILYTSMSSLQMRPRGLERPDAGSGLRGPPWASLRGMRPLAPATPAPLPGPLRRRLLKLPRSPAPARRGICGPGWLAPRDKWASESRSLAATCSSRTVRVAGRSSRARAPAGHGGQLCLGPRSGVGRLLRNLPPSSPLVWTPKEAKAPILLHIQTLKAEPCPSQGAWGI